MHLVFVLLPELRVGDFELVGRFARGADFCPLQAGLLGLHFVDERLGGHHAGHALGLLHTVARGGVHLVDVDAARLLDHPSGEVGPLGDRRPHAFLAVAGAADGVALVLQDAGALDGLVEIVRLYEREAMRALDARTIASGTPGFVASSSTSSKES